jgi:hypothetical protein
MFELCLAFAGAGEGQSFNAHEREREVRIRLAEIRRRLAGEENPNVNYDTPVRSGNLCGQTKMPTSHNEVVMHIP